MQIEPLAHHPDVIPILAGWHYREWSNLFPGGTQEDFADLLRGQLCKDAVPTAFVAFEGDRLVGSVSLVLHDMKCREDLSPWMASLFVEHGSRRQGVGTHLVRRAVREASRLGIPTLYLYTTGTENEAFYLRRGWIVRERVEYLGETRVIMLTNPPRQGPPALTYRVENRRVLALDGEDQVGRISVPDIDFHWGDRVYVRMAGIAGVGTDEAHRSRGIASAMMREAVRFADEAGYVCSGISTNFGNVARRLYARAGYTTVCTPGAFIGSSRERAPEDVPGLAFRPYRQGDAGEFLRLSEELYAPFFGWRRKTLERWEGLRREVRDKDPDFIVVAENNTGIRGWAGYYRQWVGLVAELHILPSDHREATARSLLMRLENHLNRQGIPVRIWAPPDDVFLSSLLNREGYTFRKARVFMVSIRDLPGLLDTLRPLFDGRLRNHATWKGVLRIASPLQEGFLRIGDRTAPAEPGTPDATVELPQDALVRVLSGVLTPWEAYLEGLLSIRPGMTPDLRELLSTLFPGTPWFHPADDLW